jgi:hypothetical protein
MGGNSPFYNESTTTTGGVCFETTFSSGDWGHWISLFILDYSFNCFFFCVKIFRNIQLFSRFVFKLVPSSEIFQIFFQNNFRNFNLFFSQEPQPHRLNSEQSQVFTEVFSPLFVFYFHLDLRFILFKFLHSSTNHVPWLKTEPGVRMTVSRKQFGCVVRLQEQNLTFFLVDDCVHRKCHFLIRPSHLSYCCDQ